MALSGVRNSWLIVARKRDLARFAVSARQRISRRGTRRAVSVGRAHRAFLTATLAARRRLAGTGVLIQVSSRRTSVAIDLGVRGVRHDRVQYVPAGGLSQNPDGTFSAQRVETPVELRVFQIGISIGIR